MQAELELVEYGSIARFERELNHSTEELWTALTNPIELSIWLLEVKKVDLMVGGKFEFEFSNGKVEVCIITEIKPPTVLEYTWGSDLVRFEVLGIDNRCVLILKQIIDTMTEKTIRDLTGWHICLDILEARMEDKSIEITEIYAEYLYKLYEKLVSPTK